MKTLIIINTIISIYVLIRPITKRLTFSFERTFWEKRIIGINVTIWNSELDSGVSFNSGKSIIYYVWGNRNKDNYNKRKL